MISHLGYLLGMKDEGRKGEGNLENRSQAKDYKYSENNVGVFRILINIVFHFLHAIIKPLPEINTSVVQCFCVDY